MSKQKTDDGVATDVAPDDLLTIVDSLIREETLAGHHIKSFNSFITKGLSQIVETLFKAEKVVTIESGQNGPGEAKVKFEITFGNIRVGKPKKESNNPRSIYLMPMDARNGGLNYCSEMTVDAKIKAYLYKSGKKEPVREMSKEVINVHIGNIPVMYRSLKCSTDGFDETTLRMNREDPKELGGYFILGGSEWVVSMIETRLFNSPHIFRNVGHKTERTRLEFISKPGDNYENSSEIIIRYVENGNIYIKFSSDEQLRKLEIPFYVIFRLLGMTTDKELILSIVYGYGKNMDIVSKMMLDIIRNAMTVTDNVFKEVRNEARHDKLCSFIAEKIGENLSKEELDKKSDKLESVVAFYRESLIKKLDKYLLPHVGVEEHDRHKKLRCLGHLLHKMMLVYLQISPSTDRDSLKNKRVNAAGQAYAKAFKKYFNTAVIQHINNKFAQEFKKNTFDNVDLDATFKAALKGSIDFENSMIQAIKSGNSETSKTSGKADNRLASENLHRKNQLNVLATLRVVRAQSTKSASADSRADEMRRVHSSYIGYICILQSSDTGENVGMVKQLANSTILLDSTSSSIMRKILLTDPDIWPLEKVFPRDLASGNMTKILVNGNWIGCTEFAPAIVRRYKEIRRGWASARTPKKYDSHLDKYLDEEFVPNETLVNDRKYTVYWDTDANEIHFWVDTGRLARPLIVVRNNGETDPVGRKLLGSKHNPFKHDATKGDAFTQKILITNEILRQLKADKLRMSDLHDMGLVDFISPEEMENLHVASSLEEVYANRNNPLRQYTHCEIPAALLGLPALTCPAAQHNQPPRVVFQTNQTKQTCGRYALNWSHRCDKHAFLQWYCEMPLVKTLANNYIYPNGANAIVAIACYEGFNQEDSLEASKAGAERGQFTGQHFSFIKKELEGDEKLGRVEQTLSNDTIPRDYSKLGTNSIVKEGTEISKGDIIIGKYSEIATQNAKQKDTSVSYEYDEPAIVEMSDKGINSDSKNFAIVKYSSLRQLDLGSKFSSRAGQKGMTGSMYNFGKMPFTSSGIVPDLILSPMAIPSRMTINQMIEGLAAKICAWAGTYSDATAFKKIDLKAIGAKLREFGFSPYGTERMFCGMTGEWMDSHIFISPCYYQRLQKFAVDEVYAISTSKTCVITRQPIEGKASNGGLRIGEMEKDCIVSHGAGHFLMEKFRNDSDGFVIYLCRNCKRIPNVNEEENVYDCRTCKKTGRAPDICKVNSCWSTKLFIQELESIGCGVKLTPAPFTYDA